MRKQFEYERMFVEFFAPAGVGEVLKSRGLAGWQLVSHARSSGGIELVFMREI